MHGRHGGMCGKRRNVPGPTPNARRAAASRGAAPPVHSMPVRPRPAHATATRRRRDGDARARGQAISNPIAQLVSGTAAGAPRLSRRRLASRVRGEPPP